MSVVPSSSLPPSHCSWQGTLLAGSLFPGKSMLLGPDPTGAFREVQVKSIRNKRVPVKTSVAGQTVAVALKSKKDQLKKHDVRKGMVLVDRSLVRLHPLLTRVAWWASTAFFGLGAIERPGWYPLTRRAR